MNREPDRELIDVIIPTYHPDEKLTKLLSMLSSQTLKPYRVVLVNTEQSLFDHGLIRGYEHCFEGGMEIHHIRKADFDHGGTRNYGVSLTSSPYFLFMTEDAVPADVDLLECLYAGFGRDPKVGAVYARQLTTEDSSFDEVLSRRFNYPAESRVKGIRDLPELGIKTYFQSDVCCLYRRDIFQKCGGFPDHVIFNEDMIYCASMLKAGYFSVYEADACVYHAHHYGGAAQLHRNFDLGVSQADHPEVFGGIRSEGEGVRMVREGIRTLVSSRRGRFIPCYIFRCGCRLIGYRLGKSYQHLPGWMIRMLTGSPAYWERENRV